MDITEREKRIIFEKALLKDYCPNFKVYWRRDILFISGWITTKVNRYKLRLVLPSDFPYGMPIMFLVSPKVLYTYDGKSLNSLGVSYRFHTVRDVPSDYIQISYPMIWEPCCTCVKVIIGGIVWINLYEEHLRTGKDFKWL